MTGIVSNNNNSRTSGIIKPVAGGVSGMTSDGTDITITSGNLIIGTAGKGIDFSNQASPAAGMTSELLDSYEEGTWTPAEGDSWTSFGTFTGSYTKIGRIVYITLKQTGGTSNATSDGASITGLPFTNDDTTARPQGLWGDQNQEVDSEGRMIVSATTLYTTGGSTESETNAVASIWYIT